MGKNEIQYVAEKPVRSTVDFFKRSERLQHSNITIPPFLFVEKPLSYCLYYVFTVSGRENRFAVCVCVPVHLHDTCAVLLPVFHTSAHYLRSSLR